MKVFIDIFTGDELCSDSYPMKVVDDVYYEVEGKVRKFILKNNIFYWKILLEYH